MKKTITYLAIISMIFVLSGCGLLLGGCGLLLGICSALFPENENISNASEAHMEFFEDHFPILYRDCVISHMTMCFSNDSTKNNELIRTNGFYYYPKKQEIIIADSIYKTDSESPWGREIYRAVFFENNMYGGDFYIDDEIMGVGEWGLYEIHDDTIIIESMTRGSMNGSSYGFRDTMIVKSPDTLILLSRTPICPEFQQHENYFGYYRGQRGDQLYFLPCNRVPDPENSWIIKKKWFWCEEEE